VAQKKLKIQFMTKFYNPSCLTSRCQQAAFAFCNEKARIAPFEVALVLVRFYHVARFITKPLTTIRPFLYTRRYDYQMSRAHFSNRHWEHFCCASSITRPGRVAR
jgi:hypothetical protein